MQGTSSALGTAWVTRYSDWARTGAHTGEEVSVVMPHPAPKTAMTAADAGEDEACSHSNEAPCKASTVSWTRTTPQASTEAVRPTRRMLQRWIRIGRDRRGQGAELGDEVAAVLAEAGPAAGW